MVDPPQPGEDSYELDKNERLTIHNNMKERGFLLYETFSKLEGIQCQKPQGAMYLFPALLLPKTAVDQQRILNLLPDEFYCLRLLETTGICTVPGSGFGQAEGTWHVRTTFLAPGTQWIKDWETFHKRFYDQYRD